jgi:hypothetical protein
MHPSADTGPHPLDLHDEAFGTARIASDGRSHHHRIGHELPPQTNDGFDKVLLTFREHVDGLDPDGRRPKLRYISRDIAQRHVRFPVCILSDRVPYQAQDRPGTFGRLPRFVHMDIPLTEASEMPGGKGDLFERDSTHTVVGWLGRLQCERGCRDRILSVETVCTRTLSLVGHRR